MSDDESKRVQAALLRAVASGARTRRALSGAVPGKGADAAYQRARKLGLVGGRAAPAGPTGPWPSPAERRALAAALWRMARDGADMTDRDWVAAELGGKEDGND
jgi:galactokinase/mevalonate kinase-like predicted kinase